MWQIFDGTIKHYLLLDMRLLMTKLVMLPVLFIMMCLLSYLFKGEGKKETDYAI